MNKKILTFTAFLMAVVLLSGCTTKPELENEIDTQENQEVNEIDNEQTSLEQEDEVDTSEEEIEPPMVGGDRDEHGCVGSAGYVWCESLAECIRPWETECPEEIIEEDQNNSSSSNKTLTECFAEAGMVVYGSKTCPACKSLVDSLNGYGNIELIYVECTENRDRCNQEKVTGYVPEIQIDGKVHEGGRSVDALISRTGCVL